MFRKKESEEKYFKDKRSGESENASGRLWFVSPTEPDETTLYRVLENELHYRARE